MTDVRLSQATIRQLQDIVREKDAQISQLKASHANLLAVVKAALKYHLPTGGIKTDAISVIAIAEAIVAKHSKEPKPTGDHK